MIEVRGLRKTFNVYRKIGRFRRERVTAAAVDDVSFAVGAGEIVGYVGPNGAGKSTTVKMLTGILVPSEGSLTVAGLVPTQQRVELARRIGVVFGQRSQLWWDLPLRESFDLLRHLYRVDSRVHREQLDECVERLELQGFLTTPVRQLSLGQRMRGELAAALLHRPEVLFLDEPTIGLDIVSRAKVRDFLAALHRDRGVTVMLTTHDLGDIEHLCRRLLIIDQGRVIYDGALAALRDQFEPFRTLVVDLVVSGPAISVEGAEVVKIDGPRQWLRFHREHTNAADLVARVAAHVELNDLTIEEPGIEDVITRIYRGETA